MIAAVLLFGWEADTEESEQLSEEQRREAEEILSQLEDGEDDRNEELIDEDEHRPEDEDSEFEVIRDGFVVEDQPAGSSVTVKELDLTDQRWLVVREDRQGELGNILGARLFRSDQRSGEVELQRGTEPDRRYYVILYQVAEREAQEGRTFDRNYDSPLVKSDGELMADEFRTLPQTDDEQQDDDAEQTGLEQEESEAEQEESVTNDDLEDRGSEDQENNDGNDENEGLEQERDHE